MCSQHFLFRARASGSHHQHTEHWKCLNANHSTDVHPLFTTVLHGEPAGLKGAMRVENTIEVELLIQSPQGLFEMKA